MGSFAFTSPETMNNPPTKTRAIDDINKRPLNTKINTELEVSNKYPIIFNAVECAS